MNDKFKPMTTNPAKADSNFSSWTTDTISKVQEKVDMVTSEELEKIKKEAYDKAYQEGSAKAQQELQQVVSHFLTLINGIQAPLSLIDQALEKEIISLSTWIAKQVLVADLSVKPEKIFSILNELKMLLPSSKQVRVLFLSKQDHEVVLDMKKKLTIDIDFDLLQIDEALSRGEFRVETTEAEIDANLETRMEELILHTLEQRVEDE